MNGSTAKNLSLSDHPAIREYQIQQRFEKQIEMLKLDLAQEKRDHRQTSFERDALARRVDGFERTIKVLSDHIEKLEAQK